MACGRKEGLSMFVTLNFVPLFLAILLCCPESETASTAFTTRPSDPSYAVEGRDFTLEWTYTLDGPVISVQFSKESVSGMASIIGKTIGEGNLTFFDPKYQVHFKGQATNHRTELTILAVQRSDEAKYHLYVTPNGTGSLHHEVAVIVQSDPTLTVAPSTTISQQVDTTLTMVPPTTISQQPDPTLTVAPSTTISQQASHPELKQSKRANAFR